MPAVGVERLGAGQREDDAAEGQEGREPVVGEEPGRPRRREGLEHAGMGHDLAGPEDPDGREPDEEHGPKSQPTAPVPRRWTRNSPASIPSEMGTTRCESPGAATFRPSTAEVTEMAGVIIPSPKNSPAPKMPSVMSIAVRPTATALDQGGQGHDPAVAAVVHAHQENRVLERDDDRHRPEDQRGDPVDAGHRRARGRGVEGEDHMLGVERARPQVAEDDAERARGPGRAGPPGRRCLAPARPWPGPQRCRRSGAAVAPPASSPACARPC